MSRRPPITQEQWKCSMKRRHASQRVAIRAADERKKRTGIALFTYRCPHCKSWHLTRNTQVQTRAHLPGVENISEGE